MLIVALRFVAFQSPPTPPTSTEFVIFYIQLTILIIINCIGLTEGAGAKRLLQREGRVQADWANGVVLFGPGSNPRRNRVVQRPDHSAVSTKKKRRYELKYKSRLVCDKCLDREHVCTPLSTFGVKRHLSPCEGVGGPLGDC